MSEASPLAWKVSATRETAGGTRVHAEQTGDGKLTTRGGERILEELEEAIGTRPSPPITRRAAAAAAAAAAAGVPFVTTASVAGACPAGIGAEAALPRLLEAVGKGNLLEFAATWTLGNRDANEPDMVKIIAKCTVSMSFGARPTLASYGHGYNMEEAAKDCVQRFEIMDVFWNASKRTFGQNE